LKLTKIVALTEESVFVSDEKRRLDRDINKTALKKAIEKYKLSDQLIHVLESRTEDESSKFEKQISLERAKAHYGFSAEVVSDLQEKIDTDDPDFTSDLDIDKTAYLLREVNQRKNAASEKLKPIYQKIIDEEEKKGLAVIYRQHRRTMQRISADIDKLVYPILDRQIAIEADAVESESSAEASSDAGYRLFGLVQVKANMVRNTVSHKDEQTSETEGHESLRKGRRQIVKALNDLQKSETEEDFLTLKRKRLERKERYACFNLAVDTKNEAIGIINDKNPVNSNEVIAEVRKTFGNVMEILDRKEDSDLLDFGFIDVSQQEGMEIIRNCTETIKAISKKVMEDADAEAVALADLAEESERLRALCREHGIDPDEELAKRRKLNEK
jgi:hypothetical protein